jgi:hypothetical protein
MAKQRLIAHEIQLKGSMVHAGDDEPQYEIKK